MPRIKKENNCGLQFVLLLIAVFASCQPEKNQNTCKEIVFNTSDGVVINGVFKAPVRDKSVFILLHGLGSVKEEWGYFEKKLEENGYGYLAYDARGHGSSRLSESGRVLDYRYFSVTEKPETEWEKMIKDAGCAVDFVRRNGCGENRIVLAGASLGANIALNYAAGNKNIRTVILLSPGIVYAGIRTAPLISGMSEKRIYMAASERDTYAFKSSQALFHAGRLLNNIEFEKLSGSGHGVNMFGGGLEGKIMEWIKLYLDVPPKKWTRS